jgi:hypothetical protein
MLPNGPADQPPVARDKNAGRPIHGHHHPVAA